MNRLKWRRFKQKISDHKLRFILIIVFIFIFMLGSGYALYNTTLRIGGSATIGEASECDINITGNYEVTNSWGGGGSKYNYDIRITIVNRDVEDIEDWVLIIDGPSDIGIGWVNAEYTIDNNLLTLTPLSYNRVISGSSTFTFEFNVNTIEDELNINSMSLNGCTFYGSGNNYDDTLTALEISPSSATISEGEVLVLDAVKTPFYNKSAITWSSSDSSIASVDSSGTVTGVSVGTATITAECDGISASSTITVTESVIVLESITITPSSYRMTLNEEVTLQVTKNPSNAAADITWSSSDTSVATVDQNGKVTAVALGSAVITATADGKTSTCNIRVANAFSSNDVRISHEELGGGYYSGNRLLVKVTVDNLTEDDINYFKIYFDLPTDVTWDNWQPQAMILNQNYAEIIYDETGNNKLAGNGSYEFSGIIIFPDEYLIDAKNEWGGDIKLIPDEYLNLDVINVEIE